MLRRQKVENFIGRLQDGVHNPNSLWKINLESKISIILTGTNDCIRKTPILILKENFERFVLEILQRKCIRLIVCNLPPMRNHNVIEYNCYKVRGIRKYISIICG